MSIYRKINLAVVIIGSLSGIAFGLMDEPLFAFEKTIFLKSFFDGLIFVWIVCSLLTVGFKESAISFEAPFMYYSNFCNTFFISGIAILGSSGTCFIITIVSQGNLDIFLYLFSVGASILIGALSYYYFTFWFHKRHQPKNN